MQISYVENQISPKYRYIESIKNFGNFTDMRIYHNFFRDSKVLICWRSGFKTDRKPVLHGRYLQLSYKCDMLEITSCLQITIS